MQVNSKIITLSFLLSIVASLSAQIHEWAIPLGGSSFDFGHAICVDDSGNVYTTGIFRSTADFNPSIWSTNLTSQGAYDVYIHKADSAGNLVWAKSMGSSRFDYGQSIAVDKNGSVYTTGFFYNTVDFDPGPGTFNLTANRDSDGYILKLDASGNFLWAFPIAGNGFDSGESILIDNSGNVITTGHFDGIVDFDPDTGITNVSSGVSTNIFVQKLNSSGKLVWAKSIGSDFTGEIGLASAVDTFGNIYTTGYFYGTADFDPNTGTTMLTSSGGEDVFIQKMDASGNFVWAKSFGGAVQESSESISTDLEGNVYLTGHFEGTVDFDPDTTVTLNITSAGDKDIFIQKLDSSGNLLWAKTFGNTLEDRGASIYVDRMGNVYTTGRFLQTIDFDPGAGVANLNSANNSPDIYIHKMDAAGNFLWAHAIGQNGFDVGEGITVDQFGTIYTTGYFDGLVDFDLGTGVDNILSAGFNDAFVHKMSQINTTDLVHEKTDNSIQVITYPNPSKGSIQIQLKQAFANVRVEIRDISGRMVHEEEYESLLNTNIELNKPAGIYFLTLRTKQSQTVIKLIKE